MDHLEWWWPRAPSPFAITVVGGVGFALLSAPVWMLSRRGADNHPSRPLVFEGTPSPVPARESFADQPDPDLGPDPEPWLPPERDLGPAPEGVR